MHKALNKTLAALPEDTKVYVWLILLSCPIRLNKTPTAPSTLQLLINQRLQPGHEYTKANAKFAASVLPSEPIKKLQAFAESNRETQGRFTIGDEKVLNPGSLTPPLCLIAIRTLP